MTFVLLGYSLARSLDRAEDAAAAIRLLVAVLVASWLLAGAARAPTQT